MVTHTIDFVGSNSALKNVTINGKIQKFQSVDRNTNRITFQTESESTEVVLYETHQYTGKCWFLRWLLFYIISVFGLFDEVEKVGVGDYVIDVSDVAQLKQVGLADL